MVFHEETLQEATLFAVLGATPLSGFGSLYCAPFARWLAAEAPALCTFLRSDDDVLTRLLRTLPDPSQLPLLLMTPVTQERDAYVARSGLDPNERLAGELLATTCALAAPLLPFVPLTPHEVLDLETRFAEARRAVPGARTAVTVSRFLGLQGRVLSDQNSAQSPLRDPNSAQSPLRDPNSGSNTRIFVGLPAPWHDGDLGATIALYLHEEAVISAGRCAEHDGLPATPHARWARVERDAIDGLSMHLAQVSPRRLAEDHRRLVARWSLADLAASDGARAAAVANALAGPCILHK